MSQVTIIAPPASGPSGIATIEAGDNISVDVVNPTTVLISVSGTNNHSVLYGNTDGSINSLGVGPSGTILVGTGGAPAWSVTPSVNGSVTANEFNIPNTTANFGVGFYAQNGQAIFHNYSSNATIDQIFIGQNAGNASAPDNTGTGTISIGTSAMQNLTGGISFCTVIGSYAYQQSTGSNAVVIGYFAANGCPDATGSVIIGSQSSVEPTNCTNSVIIGFNTLSSAGGDNNNNVVLGASAGSSWNSNESNNILIANAGVASEQGTTRIGTSGTTEQTFISGISGVSDLSGTLNTVVGISSTDQLTSVTLLPGTGITLTPADGSMTFSASGSLPSLAIGSAAIDSSGVFSSTAQPSFQALLSSDQANATGNGASFTVICNTIVHQNGSGYSNSTGVFTVPSTGFYSISAQLMIKALSSVMTSGTVTITGLSVPHITYFNPFAMQNILSGFITINVSTVAYLTASSSLGLSVAISGGIGNTATVSGSASNYLTSFGAVKLN